MAAMLRSWILLRHERAFSPRPEERRLRRVSKDEAQMVPGLMVLRAMRSIVRETAQERLLTMRV
jgi:hypothetical protein